MSEQRFTFGEFVLLRAKKRQSIWNAHCYAYEDDDYIVMVGGNAYNKSHNEILPYKGNEYLLGTNTDPKLKWEPKNGEVVKVRDCEYDSWVYRCFNEMTSYNEYECYCQGSDTETVSWKYCESLTDEEKGNV